MVFRFNRMFSAIVIVLLTGVRGDFHRESRHAENIQEVDHLAGSNCRTVIDLNSQTAILLILLSATLRFKPAHSRLDLADSADFD